MGFTTTRTQAPKPHSGIPPVMTVFADAEGGIRHARCGHEIAFRGSRGGLEYDFYCPACHEHISLPQYALKRMPRRADRR